MMPTVTPSDEGRRVLLILRRFGWNATSFQVLEPGLHYWFADHDAVVAYVDTGKAWVAAGAPLAAEGRLGSVGLDFVRAAKAHGRRAVFFATESRFLGAPGFRSLLIGEQPIYDPADWSRTVAGARSLREQLRRARAKAVVVRRVLPEMLEYDSALRAAIDALIEQWMGQKPMPPMGFLVRVHPFSFLEERRVFVAEQQGKLVAFAAVVPVYAREGWFIEDLIRSPRAPNGTTELLVDAAILDAAALGSSYVTLGLVPLANTGEPWFRAARLLGQGLYDFGGLQAFKAKFRPREWAPIYLSYPAEQRAHWAVYDSLVAFAQGGLLRYGLEALLRGPKIAVQLLAALLIPWTLLLAGVDGRHWFGSTARQSFWVVFDALLCWALFSLSVRWRPWLANLLLVLIGGDALATWWMAFTFEVTKIHGFFESLLLIAALFAPMLGFLVVYNARKRARLAAELAEG